MMLPASIACTVKVKSPLVVGVPDRMPPVLRVRPGGSVPPVVVKVYGAVPPVAANVCRYATPFVPGGNAAGLRVSNGDAVFIRVKDAALPTPATVAVTVYVPAVPFAVNAGAVATPLAVVATAVAALSPAKAPL